MQYKRQTEIAIRLIAKYGSSAILKQVSEVENAEEPWKKRERVTVSYPCDIVVFPITNRGANFSDLNEAQVYDYAEEMYISPNLTVKPRPDDIVQIAEVKYIIKNVKEINPNTQENILYICGVTK